MAPEAQATKPETEEVDSKLGSFPTVRKQWQEGSPPPEGGSANHIHLLYVFHRCLPAAQSPASGALKGGGTFEGGGATEKEVGSKECALEGTQEPVVPYLSSLLRHHEEIGSSLPHAVGMLFHAIKGSK